IRGGQQLRDAVARDRIGEHGARGERRTRRDAIAEFGPVGALLVLQARAPDLEPRVEPPAECLLEAVEQRRVPLPRRRAAEREEPERAALRAPAVAGGE